jgi:predicted Zn-dependent protease
MRAAYIIETGTWDGDVIAIDVDLTKLRPSSRLVHLFATGFAAVKRQDLETAHKALSDLQKQMELSKSAEHDTHHGMAPYGGMEQKTGEIIRDELKASILFAEGKQDEAIAMMKKAADAEAGLTFEFGPPEIVKPTHELLGEMLLDAGKPQEAQSYFETALQRAPRRALSMQGLARATNKELNAKAQSN